MNDLLLEVQRKREVQGKIEIHLNILTALCNANGFRIEEEILETYKKLNDLINEYAAPHKCEDEKPTRTAEERQPDYWENRALEAEKKCEKVFEYLDVISGMESFVQKLRKL